MIFYHTGEQRVVVELARSSCNLIFMLENIAKST